MVLTGYAVKNYPQIDPIGTPLTAITTSLVVWDGSAFPTALHFVTIEEYSTNAYGVETVSKREICTATRSWNTFTLTRAQDGTSAQTFTANARMSLYWVAGQIEDIQDAIQEAEGRIDTVENDISTLQSIPGTAKTTPVDADWFTIWDSVASFAKKYVTWTNIKATLKTYFDTLYVALTWNQTIAGVKTFSSFPVTPSSAPTTDYQVANKKYVDDASSPYWPSMMMPLISWNYYGLWYNWSNDTDASATNRMNIVPVIFAQNMTIDQITLDCTAGATGNMMMILYADNNGVPWALIDAMASTAVASTNTWTKSYTFNAGTVYWLATRTSAWPTFRTRTNAFAFSIWCDSTGTTSYTLYRNTTAYTGTAPDPCPASTLTGDDTPAFIFRVA